MLRSMVESPRPTRAEVTDVANAILDGSDAVMLSEETAIGKYPLEAVVMMGRIACEAERSTSVCRPFPRDPESLLGSAEAVAEAAGQLADGVGADALVTCTQSGSTTRLVAKYRPRTPILAVTPEDRTYRRLALVWGAVPVRMEPAESMEEVERQALEAVVRGGHARAGATVIITAGLPLHQPGTTNSIKVARAGEGEDA
jgi:pyruvate kinase